MKISMRVNGQDRELDIDGQTPLLWVLRDELNMTGTKYGCGKALCGACTVHLNGNAVRSCVLPVSAVANSDITTIEGVDSKAAAAVSKAWAELDVPQCGFCQSGQIMTAVDLLTKNPNPTDEEIDAGMTGNLCRCATYVRIRQAMKNAASDLEGQS